jgi:eukaryotic-like serine/threonine-protein kinase
MSGIPEKIGIFEVIRQIGSGGMGAVYLGRDPELDRQVAIKVIREEVHDQEVLDRFFREARSAAALRHANVITVYASGQQNHQPYIVMEYIEGESFGDIIRDRRDIPLSVKVSYLEQVCAGLGFAHKAGIVHRDVKPANIMIDREGVVRILDFGIARVEGSAMTQDGTMMGSLNYMSPEQMLGRQVDPRSDIFAVGCVAYELLSYQQAFKGNLNDGLLHRLPNEDPPSLLDFCRGLPLAIEQVIMRALEKDPGRRYQNLGDMRTALANAHTASKQVVALQPIDDGPTELIERPPTIPSTSPKSPASSGYAGLLGSLPAAAVSGSAVTPSPTPSSPHPAPSTGPKSRKETGGVTPWSPPVEKPQPTPRVAPSLAASKPIALANPAPPPKRPSGTAAPPAPRFVRSSPKRWLLGMGVVIAAIAAAAAAIPWFSTPPPEPLTVEGPRIESTLEQYRGAYRNRDLDGIIAVYPTLPEGARRTMQQAFANCLVYEVTFAAVQVTLDPEDPTRASVDVQSTHTCTPNSGGRQSETSRSERFSLRKNGEAWLIDTAAPVSTSGAK